jgi:glutamate-1-semialdehyde 2,1-aminomutase
MKVVAVVQARMGSTRLPNKVMRSIYGVPLIERLLRRLSRAREVHQIVLATSIDASNQPLADHVTALGFPCWRGSETDVLSRYLDASHAHCADLIVRITGDCPLIDPALVDACVCGLIDSGVDYFSNVQPARYPDGLDVEVFTVEALERSHRLCTESANREHVTPFIRESDQFRRAAMTSEVDLSALRWTVDELDDLDVVCRVFEHFLPREDFSWNEVLALSQQRPELFSVNQHIMRNEGANMGSGQKLWKRAKQIIPGGNMLLSKRAEMFLPELWPAYFSKAKGCRVWDLDGRELIDMSIMGIGTNTLGYGHPEVDAAVRRVVDAGNMSTLNCPEEVYLAEKLVELHPWGGMVKFARSGGEANAVAVRIARAASGRDRVAVCGYHGWHDWYLSANIADDKSLDGHLLPGLEPKGVPRSLKGSVIPFEYNDFDALVKIVDQHDVGVIKMEVSRNHGPADGFLHKVRTLATAKNAVLVFDECTSGFRETFGGLHKKYGVEPDMAMFGKALGNGYGITAILGRREIMEAAQSTFISSTFWTERIGPAAGLATLQVMESIRSWETITATGLRIKQLWQQIADRQGVAIEQWGIPALSGFNFQGANAAAYKTLVTQEMLKQGYLAANSIYVCIDHTAEVVDRYMQALDGVFALIRQCEDGRDVHALLQGPVCHTGFKRLN